MLNKSVILKRKQTWLHCAFGMGYTMKSMIKVAFIAILILVILSLLII